MAESLRDHAELELGQTRDASQQALTLPPQALLRHMMALGSSGSGKTVLSKVVVEEMVGAGIPALCLDPQGDLCSLALAALEAGADAGDDGEAAALLAERGIDPELARRFAAHCDVVVFTPASDKGIALGADPLAALQARAADHGGEIDEELWTRAAATVAGLLGYSSDDDDGEGLIAVLDTALRELAEAGRAPASLRELSEVLAAREQGADGGLAAFSRFLDLKVLRQAIRKLARLEVGPRRKLFSAGVPLDIDLLMGRRGDAQARVPAGKTRIAIVHLNSLHAQEDKEFMVAAVAEQLYAWMLAHPSSDPQLLFYLDEIAPYMPPVRKPQCKDALQLLFKQARKYGVCCLMATQNPGDVDYRAMAQFGTWALGRLTTRQDLKKIEPTVKSLAPATCDAVMGQLPRLEPGQFVLLSPDHFAEPVALQTRWLLTRHETLDESRIAELADARWRRRFAGLLARKSTGKSGKSAAKVVEQPPDDPPEQVAEPAKVTVAEKAAAREAAAAEKAAAREAAAAEKAAAAAEKAAAREAAAAEKAAARQAAIEEKAAREAAAAEDKVTRAAAKQAQENADREAQLSALRNHGPVDVKQFAEILGCSESKARRALKLLVEAGLVGDFKQGRAASFWALDTGARPDLGMPESVMVATPGMGQDQAAVIGQGLLRSSILGSLTGSGPAESLINVSLAHKLLWRVDFEERVEAGLLGRLASFGAAAHEDRLGSVYLHPRNLAVLTWERGRGLRFVDAATLQGTASDVHDLDGVVRFVALAPAGLRFDESEWTARRSAEEVQAAFARRWPARVVGVSPVFLPLWKLMIRRHEPAGMRVAMIDAISGDAVDWPRE